MAPAEASGATFNIDNLKLPAGLALSDLKITKEDSRSSISWTISRTGSVSETKVLKIKDLKISGLPKSVSNQLSSTYYGYLRSNLTFVDSIYLSDTDLTALTGTLTLSGIGTLETRNDFAFPNSFSEVTTKLANLGFEVTYGFHSWGGVSGGPTDHSIYVEGRLKAGVKPFIIKIDNSTFKATGLDPIPLTNSDSGMLINAETTEINLGKSDFDLGMGGYSNTSVSADFSVAVENTYKTNVEYAAGLDITVDPKSTFYNSENDTTGFYIWIKNPTKETISFDPKNLQITETVKGVKSVIAKTPSDWGYFSFRPRPENLDANNCGYCLGNYLVAKGDHRYGASIELTGKVALAVPSRINTKRVKVPAGFKVLPIDFNNTWYDPIAKTTTVYLELTSDKDLEKSPAVAASALHLSGGKINEEFPFTSGYLSEGKDLLNFYVAIGTIKGNVRKGRYLSVAGTFTTVARTQVTDSAVPESGLDAMNVYMNSPAVTPPELWTYDVKTNLTTILANIQTYRLATQVDIYFCEIAISIDGKAVKPIAEPYKLRTSSIDNSWISAPVATVPGDIRVKGKPVLISGTYRSSPCN